MNEARNKIHRANPFEPKLHEEEILLWVGRPNKKIYTSANTRWPHAARVCALAAIPLTAAVIGVIFSSDLLGRYASMSLLIAVPVITFMLLSPADYQQASWYAFSNKNVFLAHWDEGDFVVHCTDIGNLKEIYIKKRKDDKAAKDDDIGSIQCICNTTVFTLLSKKFSFDDIDSPKKVQLLLLEAKDLIKEN